MSAQLYALAALALGLESGAIGRRSYCWPMLVGPDLGAPTTLSVPGPGARAGVHRGGETDQAGLGRVARDHRAHSC